MAKQEVVLKLSMENAKKRAKAMRCAVGLHGVVSVLSQDGDKMTVVGEGIDSVELVKLLRKKMGYVELVTVTAYKEKKEEKKVDEDTKSITPPWNWPYYYTQPPYYCVEAREPSYDQINCSIM